jgi:hypothetical protein
MFTQKFKEDYEKLIRTLYEKVEPLIKDGWSEEDVYQFFLFIEKNQDKIKGKSFDKIKSIYLESKKKY